MSAKAEKADENMAFLYVNVLLNIYIFLFKKARNRDKIKRLVFQTISKIPPAFRGGGYHSLIPVLDCTTGMLHDGVKALY